MPDDCSSNARSQPGSRWTESATEVRLVTDVCRRLDGLPLAIELAAAKTPWLALPDLVRHLDRQLGQARGNPLDAALRMSRALLGAAEAQAFDALSVFAGSFTFDAALAVIEVVCPEHDALAVFERLVDHSLINVTDGEPRRYRLLETIQRYADMCRLSSAAPDVPVRAHARFYLDFIERRWPAGRIVTDTPWEVLGAEMTEVLAAVERAAAYDPGLARQLVGAVGWYWSFGGYAEQCEEFGARLSGGAGTTPRQLRPRSCGLARTRATCSVATRSSWRRVPMRGSRSRVVVGGCVVTRPRDRSRHALGRPRRGRAAMG